MGYAPLWLKLWAFVSLLAFVGLWWCTNCRARRRLDAIWARTAEPGSTALPPEEIELAKVRLEYHCKRHEEVNEWRQQTSQGFFALQAVVLAGAGAAVATIPSDKLGLLAFILAPIVVAGLCIYIRMAITRCYAVEQVNSYRLWTRKAFGSPRGSLSERLEAPFSLGSHFWSDAAIAVLNSGVAVLAAYALAVGAGQAIAPRAWTLVASGTVEAHLLVYGVAICLSRRLLTGGKG